MYNKLKIDKRKRKLFMKNEINKNVLKYLAFNEINNLETRWKYIIKLSKFKNNSHSSKIHNFCVLSGRSKANYKNFKISRLIFRDKAVFSKLVGLKKSSW